MEAADRVRASIFIFIKYPASSVYGEVVTPRITEIDGPSDFLFNSIQLSLGTHAYFL